MKRVLSIVSLLGAWTVGCQFISGVNDLEVVEDASGGSAGAGAEGGDGGNGGDGGSGGGNAGSGGDGGSAGTAGDGGTSSTSMGGSAGTGGSQATGGATSTTSTTTTGTTTTGGTGGCSDQPGWECDVVSQCGCRETENCSYNIDTDVTACGPAGDQEPYHVCDVNSDCPRGHGCIGGICKQHCVSADDCGWEHAACLDVYDEDEEVIEGFGYCSEECNLIEPTEPLEGGVACDENSTCYPYANDAGNLHTTCVASDGAGVQGDPCDNLVDCAPGYFCDYDVSGTCHRLCELGDENGCEGGGDCVALSPRVYLGDIELGHCFVCDTGDFECSVFPECGCGGGNSCKITDLDTGATECIAEGTVPAWGACENLAECESGSSCVSGFCDPFCGEPGDDSCAIGDCFQAQSGDEPIPGWFYCNAPCEPVLADRSTTDDARPCPEGYLCQPVRDDPTNLDVGAYCAASGGLSEGSTCAVNADCADGLGCLEDQCTPYCRTAADCTDLHPTCYDLDPPLYAGPGDVIKQCF